MRFYRYIFIFVLCSLFFVPAQAKKPQPLHITTEREQQFKYYWYAARQAIEEERYPEAYSLLRFCQELNPDDANTLTSLGIMYDAMGDRARAKECWKRAYELSPADCWQRWLEPLKEQYIREEQWKEALKTQDEIDRYNGYDAYSAITRYRIYAMQRKNKKALKAIDDYLETDPDNLRFLLFRIDVLHQIGAKPKEMFAAFERVLDIDPYNLQTMNNYAYYMATHGGDLSKAEQMSGVTIREEPNNPSFLDTYGWIMHLKGQDELAKFYLNKALWNAAVDHRKEIQKHLDAIK